ncbi:MAG: hypothetical protein LRY71_13210 [Bacillaceae bacterium]|nr:hypothetical protein [Bacillaceae bacterium]
MTIKNDQPFFKQRIEPLAELCKENLKEVGYNISSIQFTALTSQSKTQLADQTTIKQERKTPTFTEKGFDFKI